VFETSECSPHLFLGSATGKVNAMICSNAKVTPDRSKINLGERFEVKYWTRELSIDRQQLQKLVEKVGNSAAAVRKELAT
jgi:Protein of unknown function (DUF3606)